MIESEKKSVILWSLVTVFEASVTRFEFVTIRDLSFVSSLDKEKFISVADFLKKFI